MIIITHFNAYDSFKTKRSIEKKEKAKRKTFDKQKELKENFIIDNFDDYGVVVEARYHDAYIYYHEEMVLATLRNNMNDICNQVIFPGDKVVLSNNDGKYYVENLIKRNSLLTRVKKDSTRNDDIGLRKSIAANINLAVIVVSAKEPPLHAKFIDRYLLVLQNSNIPTIICLNKCDLKTREEDSILDIYRKLDIPVIETSTYLNIGIDELKNHLQGKQAIFVGNSGVGKSSLTNAIMDSDNVKTGHTSEKSKRGRHTTTSSKYYVWDDDSSVIDTPGIRSLDVSSFNPDDIQEYFQEFDKWRSGCKYKDCLHYNEPADSCMVKQAALNGIINKNRYESYLRIMKNVLGDKSK